MATLSSLTTRRFATRQSQATQQIIVFRLRQEWFALPIQAVQKVVTLGSLYGDPQATGVGLTLYQNRELLVVDVGHRIFGDSPQPSATHLTPANNLVSSDTNQVRYLLVMQVTDELVGLPIDSPPVLRRVPVSSMAPLPAAYQSSGNIRCVSSCMVLTPEEPPLFLIDPSLLLVPQNLTSVAIASTT